MLPGLDFGEDDTSTLFDCQLNQKLVGLLLCTLNMSRLDIANAATSLLQFMQRTTVEIWKCAKHLLRNIKDTIETGIFLEKGRLAVFLDTTVLIGVKTELIENRS